MTAFHFILRSLRFHAKYHLGTLVGIALGGAILTGALIVGDSVRLTLRDMSLQRLGSVDSALASQDRWFREELADDLSAHFAPQPDSADYAFHSVLQLPSTASTPDGSARANQVMTYGVSPGFWSMANSQPDSTEIPQDTVWINQPLADHLQVKIGDTLLFRVAKPSRLSRDAPLSPVEDASTTLRLSINRILSPEHLGTFSLQASQIPPFNAFIPISLIQNKIELPGQANLLLVRHPTSTTPEILSQALTQNWQLEDSELHLIQLPGNNGGFELRSHRVFMDAPLSAAVMSLNDSHRGILTYFVNSLDHETNSTPYSMVAAVEAPFIPMDLGDNEILLTPWLAEDLQAKAGDPIRMTYYEVGLGRQLNEVNRNFVVREILPDSPAILDPTFMPDFPGMTDADNCRDWDTGFPIDTEKIRDKDEDYWDTHRGTPKAFISLKAGQALWANRFGNLTAVRFPSPASTTSLENMRTQVTQHLRERLQPDQLGLTFIPVRQLAEQSVNQSQDFGGLFIGFSFFLIGAALILISLLFQFQIERRGPEMGLLLALGFTGKKIRRYLWGEGAILAAIGSVLGALAGSAYARMMLHGLNTSWSSAVGTSSLALHLQPATLGLGILLNGLVAALTLAYSLHHFARQPAQELLHHTGDASQSTPFGTAATSKRKLWIGSICMVLAVVLVCITLLGLTSNPSGVFFGVGSLCLISGLTYSSAWMSRSHQANTHPTQNVSLNLQGLAQRNVARRPKRSLATIALLASGCFLIIAISAFRLDSNQKAEERSSGTGGFAFWGETALPVVHDLNNQDGLDFFGLDASKIPETHFVPFRVRPGEDASCLNLNRAQRPRLLGLSPDLLSFRGAFSFAKTLPPAALGLNDAPDLSSSWDWLKLNPPDGAIPAIGDQASIQWALGKKVGDTLQYTDERGETFTLVLVASLKNSLLQGNLIIAEESFIQKFPSQSGYQAFLIDAPADSSQEIAQTLSRSLRDVGLELTSAPQRLNAFNAVQNTYLMTFQVLGGLGLILGSIGLGIVVLRNLFERQTELGVLSAMGFSKSKMLRLLIQEHGYLLCLGLGIGVSAAAIAILPAILSSSSALPWPTLVGTLLAVLINGALWIGIPVRVFLRSPLHQIRS